VMWGYGIRWGGVLWLFVLGGLVAVLTADTRPCDTLGREHSECWKSGWAAEKSTTTSFGRCDPIRKGRRDDETYPNADRSGSGSGGGPGSGTGTADSTPKCGGPNGR